MKSELNQLCKTRSLFPFFWQGIEQLRNLIFEKLVNVKYFSENSYGEFCLFAHYRHSTACSMWEKHWFVRKTL